MTIFLTGFPGFIAGRLVERLTNVETKFFLLVQPAFLERAQSEVERIAAAQNVPLANFRFLTGDITLENFGLSAEDLALVQNEATDVFHLAAVYDLAVTRDLAMRVNVEGTNNVNSFVSAIKNLNCYNYISTCYVAGKRTGKILETELEHNAGFRNYYEETKYLAELEVERLKAQLPITIFRPSIVVGDSQTGETVKYDGIYYLILYLQKFPQLLTLFNIGNDEVKLNLVPVDFVVNSIAALSKDAAAKGQTLQIADPSPLSTRKLFNTISQNLTGQNSLISFPTSLVKKFLMLPVTPAISGLPHVGVPYFFLEQTYDTTIASRLLAAHNVACPQFPDYVKNLLAFVEKNPQLKL